MKSDSNLDEAVVAC